MMTNEVEMVPQCGLPNALEAMGERWSFLILRGAMHGIRHFEEFQSTMGIARNILANRLARLVDKGILVRQPMQCDRRKVEYRLTPKGEALAPVMIALRQWGEKWECGIQSVPIVCDKRDKLPIATVQMFSHDGRVLGLDDLAWVYPDQTIVLCDEPMATAFAG